MKATQRLYYTAEKKSLVPQDHPEAVALAYGVGDEVSKTDEPKLQKPEKENAAKA